MRSSNLIQVFIIFILTLVIFSCKTTPNKTFRIVDLDTSINPTKISISELAKNYKSYHGRYIETKGRFHSAFEEFAIYTNKNIFTGEADGFWLEPNEALKIDNLDFDKINGKLVTLKGRIDTTDKGHLSSYFATIKEIYFWQY